MGRSGYSFFLTLILLVSVGCSAFDTERYTCDFTGNSPVIFSFSSIENSVTLGGISFYGRESWTRNIDISDDTVSLSYVQGKATEEDGQYVGFKDLIHYQFERSSNSLTIETQLDHVHTGSVNWTHPGRSVSGECRSTSGLSYWLMFFVALLGE